VDRTLKDWTLRLQQPRAALPSGDAKRVVDGAADDESSEQITYDADVIFGAGGARVQREHSFDGTDAMREPHIERAAIADALSGHRTKMPAAV
jgi:hypothetical protein